MMELRGRCLRITRSWKAVGLAAPQVTYIMNALREKWGFLGII
mgnify:CR=1 FL=1